MKMAKASEADLDMAMKLCSALDSLERRYMPSDDSEDEIVWFDNCDADDCINAMNILLDILENGSLMRVVWGLAVLLDPANKIVDPDSDVLEVHPSLVAAHDVAMKVPA